MKRLAKALLTPPTYDNERMEMRGAVYENYVIVPDSLRLTRGAWRPTDPATIPYGSRPEVTIESGIYLGRFHTHFGHFLVETLPMLRWGWGNNETLVFHLWDSFGYERACAAYIAFLTREAGIDLARFHFVRRLTLVQSLGLCRQPMVYHGETDVSFGEIYGRVSRRQRRRASPKLLYLSRRRFARQLTDEEPIEEVFTSCGFTIVHPETLPIEDQIGLVANAHIVAGLGGSALHLCAFMNGSGACVVLKTREIPAIQAVNDALGIATFWIDAGDPALASKLQIIVAELA